MVNQAIYINGLANITMHYAISSEWSVYQWSPSLFGWESQCDYSCYTETDFFDIAHWLIILLQLCTMTSYFYVYSPNVTEYENQDIPKMYLTAEEPQ